MEKISGGLNFTNLEQVLNQGISSPAKQAPPGTQRTEFLDLLEKGLGEVNQASREAEKAGMDLASGKNHNIHETMLALTKAELSFQMMVQIRNKAIEAYQDVMRMQV